MDYISTRVPASFLHKKIKSFAMNIEITHTLARDEAKSRMMGLIDRLKSQYGGQIKDLKEQWVNYTDKIEGSARGHSVSGSINVEDKAVNIDLKIPFLLRVFSGKIRSVVEEHVKKELE
jgi:putative polyhydroxyalkanoate system protein